MRLPVFTLTKQTETKLENYILILNGNKRSISFGKMGQHGDHDDVLHGAILKPYIYARGTLLQLILVMLINSSIVC